MSNVLNHEAIDAFLLKIAKGDELIGFYLSVALKKAILKEQKFFTPVTEYPQNPPQWLTQEKFRSGTYSIFNEKNAKNALGKIQHIYDWIAGAVHEEDHWVQRQDEKGRPFTLLRIGSIADAYAAANKETKRKANILRSKFTNVTAAFEVDEQAGHIKTVKKFDNGFRIVRLLSAHALDIETAQLGHCIGNGNYDKNLERSGYEYYSLRDPLNQAHASLEVINGVLEQCKGKQNAPPNSKYMSLLYDFIRAHKWKLAECEGHTGLLEQEGVYYQIHDLPDGFKWNKNIDLNDAKWLKKFPQNFSVSGFLCFGDCVDLKFFNGLEVGDDLVFDKCSGLESLGTNIKVRMGLYLEHCVGLISLGENIIVGEDLFLEDYADMKSLGTNIKIGGDLGLKNFPSLVDLGKNIEVGCNLFIKNCPALISLPENLLVKGQLSIEDCPNLTSLPKKLFVDGDIRWNKKRFSSVDEFRTEFEKIHSLTVLKSERLQELSL